MKMYEGLTKFEETGTRVYIPEKKYSVDLSLTENPLKFSEKVLEVIEKEKFNVDHYPDPHHHDLRIALSEKFCIHKDSFIFGTGADGLIENIIRILINKGENVVMPELTFLNASFATIIAGGQVVFSKMKADFHVDFEDLRGKIDEKTKIIFICNPNNPTGVIESKDAIINLIKSTDKIVVVDEANIEFGGVSVIDEVNKLDNLVVVRTFSKAYGLAGMRIGYCAGNKNLMYYIWRLRPPFTNTYLAQKTAREALKDERHIKKSKEYMIKERNFLTKELTKRGFSVISSSANCFLVKVTPLFESSTKFNELLHQHDCTVVDGKYFRGLGDDYVRVAPRLHSINKKFIEIIDKLLK